MPRMLLLIGLLVVMLQPAHAGHKPPDIFLRIYVQTTGEGLPAMQATTIVLPPNNEEIQIRALPEVTEHELIDVKPEPDGGVRLFFNHQGQVNLSAVTAQNQDRILVVMINGYVVYAPTIANGQLAIPHPINAQALQLLQETAQKNVEKAARS
jgi:hypothetical protein